MIEPDQDAIAPMVLLMAIVAAAVLWTSIQGLSRVSAAPMSTARQRSELERLEVPTK
jgi:hypothetical protein